GVGQVAVLIGRTDLETLDGAADGVVLSALALEVRVAHLEMPFALFGWESVREAGVIWSRARGVHVEERWRCRDSRRWCLRLRDENTLQVRIVERRGGWSGEENSSPGDGQLEVLRFSAISPPTPRTAAAKPRISGRDSSLTRP